MLINGFSEIVKEVKEPKGVSLGMLAATLGASILGTMLSGKGVARGGDGVIRAGEGAIRAGEEQDFWCYLIL